MPAAFDWDQFVTIADRAMGEFADRTSGMTELVDSSILFSDGLCFCALCEMFEVDHIIEAGTGYGGSTEMFARYFADGRRVKHIVSIDDAVNPRWQRLLAVLHLRHYSRFVWSSEKRAAQVARARLASFPRVTLVRGDAVRELPAIVKRIERERGRVGLLIDGPKGELQMQLADQMFALSPSVVFAALDDIGPMFDAEGRHANFRAHPQATFATSDREYFDRFGQTNRGRLPGRMANDPAHAGYGMGILVNR